MFSKLKKFIDKNYSIFFVLIISVFLTLRITPPLGGNFYFTMDQGNDAVHVRELLHGNPPPLGPETSIFGLFAGPLWYYFLGAGYLIFRGNPIGGVVALISLNTLFLGILMKKIKVEVSPLSSLFVGLNLTFSWALYNTSRYAFNPFPMVILSFLIIASLIDFHRTRKSKHLFLASIFVGLSFHTDVASALALAIFFGIINVFFMLRKHLLPKQFFYSLCVVALFLSPHVIFELKNDFPQTKTLLKEASNPGGVFQNRQVGQISRRFMITIAESTFREIPELGLLLFCVALWYFFNNSKSSPSNSFSKWFVYLSLLLTFVSWAFFISNSGWRDWHTAFLSPLIFISFLLLLSFLPKKLMLLLYLFSLYSHLHIFSIRYFQYLKPADDPSLLINEVKAIDWVYQHSGSQGFYVYNYLPSIYDYPYQYLFWWHGLKKYGYLPCEYAPYKNSRKLFYPPLLKYSKPSKFCANQMFLIIEPDERITPRENWMESISKDTTLVDQAYVGKILIQKRVIDP